MLSAASIQPRKSFRNPVPLNQNCIQVILVNASNRSNSCRYYTRRLRIFAVCLNFALWGSVLAWVVQALLLLSPDIENAYGLKRGLPLGKALVVGWYALFGLLGAVTGAVSLALARGSQATRLVLLTGRQILLSSLRVHKIFKRFLNQQPRSRFWPS